MLLICIQNVLCNRDLVLTEKSISLIVCYLWFFFVLLYFGQVSEGTLCKRGEGGE